MEPVFKVLETYIKKTDTVKGATYDDPWDCMYMGRVGDIYLYKHVDSRRYLNIDSQGKFYKYCGNGYSEIDKNTALLNMLS